MRLPLPRPVDERAPFDPWFRLPTAARQVSHGTLAGVPTVDRPRSTGLTHHGGDPPLVRSHPRRHTQGEGIDVNDNPVDDAVGTEPERYLLLGDVSLHFPLAPRPDSPLVVLRLAPSPFGSAGPQAVEYLKPASTATRWAMLLDGAGQGVTRRFTEPVVAWRGTSIDADFAGVLARWRTPGDRTADLETITPLAVLRVHRGAGHDRTEVLMCSRMREVGALFARVATVELPAGVTWSELTRAALTRAHDLRDQVAVEWQEFTHFEEQTEIELKLGLKERVSPWGLASGIAADVRDGHLPGFVPDVGNELQRWHFQQHTFEVLEPVAERGYLGFVQKPSGDYELKHKVFAADAMRRTETFRQGLEIPAGDFAGVLARDYPGLTCRRLPSFTRCRFDVNVESTATGHFFGIEIDEVVVPEYDAVLQQVEIEYHRSRVHDGLDPASIDTELYRLADAVGEWLAKAGVTAEKTFYSKLSFLRECVAGERPPARPVE
ncbi:hypothetical protein GA0070611_0790 [Micromonospora auratinigra]|uniref:Uncharacterized protein n=1 Tax=Micromonospora auratinigra TaxID=261654 RepID=A0A1A8Z5N7_9ACTN|nr:hypothetical protein GA0070611_0790 [Micromonospora auratinigra]